MPARRSLRGSVLPALAGLGCAAVLLALGWHARAGTPPAADARLHEAVGRLAPRIAARSDLLDDWIGYLAVYVTNLVALAVVAAVLGAVALRRGIRAALGVLLVLAAAVAAVYVLKAAFDRAPGAYEKYELPSGHATRSMLAAGLAVAATWRTSARWPVLAGAAAYVLAVAFSLVYEDWHLPSDVLAAWALAGATLSALLLARPWAGGGTCAKMPRMSAGRPDPTAGSAVAARPEAPPARPLRARTALVAAWAGTAAAVALGIVAVQVFDRPLSDLTRDPVAVAGGAPIYIGYLSHVGVLLWMSVAGAGIVAGETLRRLGRPPARLLLWAGALSGVLAIDDLFRVHETLYERLGVPQPVLPALYAVAVVLLIVTHLEQVRRSPWPLLVTAFALLGASAAIDAVLDPEPTAALEAVEDIVKLFGIAAWAAYWGVLAVGSLTAAAAGLESRRRERDSMLAGSGG